MLRFYFRSGWAFLIPYLVVYLLYAWLKWPVNPITQGAGSMVQGARSWMPCLLHVYWSFHIAHLCLGALALRAWWLTSEATKTGALHHNSRQLGNTLQVTGNRLHATIYQLLPWICLGLIFWISSVYLEFPSDPWEHYRRINLWGQFNDVTSNSVWIKSSYFFAYSFTSNLTAAQQFDRLNYYTTGLNILLCFQYYRLGRAIGLSVNAAIIFVILQSLLFGNNLFSFYNYYSLSSTAIAQIAAIALICTGYRFVAADSAMSPFRRPGWLVIPSSLSLCLLMAFNHVQALGIAFLGLLAVAIWRLEQWKRGSGFWLLAGLMLAGLSALWWIPLNPVLQVNYRSEGWLNQWYGFDLFTPNSPASGKMIQILGGFGLINVASALILLRRNHVAAWLTLMPLIALSMPVFAIPLAETLAIRPLHDIDIFHRMFLGIPAGLSLVVFIMWLAPSQPTGPEPNQYYFWLRSKIWSPFAITLVALITLLTVPSSMPFYNRSWHALARPPNDLSGVDLLKAFFPLDPKRFKSVQSEHFVTTEGAGFIASATGVQLVTFNERLNSSLGGGTIALAAEQMSRFLGRHQHERDITLFVPSAHELYTPGSQTGYLSSHWLAHEVALEHAGGPESLAIAAHLGAKRESGEHGEYFQLKR